MDSIPNEIRCNWDSDDYHDNLWWALGGPPGQAWKRIPALATAKAHTILGYDGAAMRGLGLGMQFASAVPILGPAGERRERYVIRTTQLPKEAEGVLARTMCTIGGHAGTVIRKAIPRHEDMSASAAHQHNLREAIGALKGLAWLGGQAVIQQLFARGALRVADTTPPLTCTKMHNDANIPAAYEHEHQFPVLTLLGNLNNVPELKLMVKCFAASLTFRRRLVIFQQATGVEPPAENARFRLALPWGGSPVES